MKRRIYLDHNATTPLSEPARAELIRVLDTVTGNPSSVHSAGRAARAVLEEARDGIARSIGARSQEIVFTSGGTEANNLALLGAASAAQNSLIISSETEHPSIIRPLRHLESRGHRVRFIPVDRTGIIDLDALSAALEPEALVSIQSANQETGALQPLTEIVARCKRAAARLHVDASQSYTKQAFVAHDLKVDLATLSAHKLGGPVGIGALYVRGPHLHQRLENVLWGGSQEFERRPGTTPHALAKSFSTAVDHRLSGIDLHSRTMCALRDSLAAGIAATIPGMRILTPLDNALPHTLCCAFPNCDRLALTINLDLAGFCVSPGSACSSGSVEPSPVLAAMGVPEDLARGAIRISLGPGNSAEDVAALLAALPDAVERSSFLGPSLKAF